jgi:hypothetical protein
MIVNLSKIKCLKEFRFVPAKGKDIGITLHLEGTESVIKEIIDSISIKDKKPAPKPTKAEEKAKSDAEKLEVLSQKSGPRFESEEDDDDTEMPDEAVKGQASLMNILGLPE